MQKVVNFSFSVGSLTILLNILIISQNHRKYKIILQIKFNFQYSKSLLNQEVKFY